MKIGILGDGMVGRTLAEKLTALGHEVKIGKRGTFGEAAGFGDLLMSCTTGTTSLDALRSCPPETLNGKTLIDISNPLDFSKGLPPTLMICNDDSLGETIQREFPQLNVVKALNTANCQVMVNPARVAGEHDLFIAGNSADAKQAVTELLRSFGWRTIIDLGDITGARATETLMFIWMRLYGMYGPLINFHIARA
ncbi:MAG: NADP oxidoreductase [Acidobacteria bacterium]|nr:NADP oxidoreductase [Acidobacteriota bacterium]